MQRNNIRTIITNGFINRVWTFSVVNETESLSESDFDFVDDSAPVICPFPYLGPGLLAMVSGLFRVLSVMGDGLADDQYPCHMIRGQFLPLSGRLFLLLANGC